MVKPGRYRHFKGKEYEVIGTAMHSETLEEYTVHCTAKGSCGSVRRRCGTNLLKRTDGKCRDSFISEKIEKRAQDETEGVSRALVFFATIFFVFPIKNAGRQRTEEGKEKHPFFSRENIEKMQRYH